MSTFRAEVFRIEEPGGWYFVAIPAEHAPDSVGPWGRSPVTASIEGHTWHTSAWRDTKRGWLLPLPKSVRGDVEAGDIVDVDLEPRPEP